MIPEDGTSSIDRLRAELAESRRRIEDLETLGRTVDLLDSSLDVSRLTLLALQLSLRLLRGDGALLIVRDGGEESAHFLARGRSTMTRLEENPSLLARDVLRTGEGGVRRGRESPGARAAAKELGDVPALRIALPLTRGDRVLGVLEVAYREEPEARLQAESASLSTVVDHLAIALDNARLLRENTRRLRELSLLYDIGTEISAHLDLDELLRKIVDSILELVPADAIGIFLIDRGTREIRKETLGGYEESRFDDVRLKVGKGILGWVASTGEGIIIPDVTKDSRYVDVRPATRSEMAAPLRYEGRVIGVVNLERDTLSAYGPADLELLTNFGNQAAISITNARLHEVAREKRRLEEQLQVARDIQTRLLPGEAPRIPGHVLTGRNVPSSEVGGDYFDFVPLSDDRWAIVVADVSGNGIPAGLIMAGFRAEVRAGLRHGDDPRRVLTEVNRVLCGELEDEHFVTALLGVYSPASGTLVYSNAGHEPGLLIRRDGSLERLHEGGLLLGVFPNAVYGRAMVHLAPGDRLLLYTDGLSDAGDPWGDRLGEEGILRLLRAALQAGIPAADLPDVILARAQAEVPCPEDEADDRTLVALYREAVA